jgi:hypothetical protein
MRPERGRGRAPSRYGLILTCTSRRVDEPARRSPFGVRARTKRTSAPLFGAFEVSDTEIATVPSAAE